MIKMKIRRFIFIFRRFTWSWYMLSRSWFWTIFKSRS